jgi:type IV secretory pathway VirB4 component
MVAKLNHLINKGRMFYLIVDQFWKVLQNSHICGKSLKTREVIFAMSSRI